MRLGLLMRTIQNSIQWWRSAGLQRVRQQVRCGRFRTAGTKDHDHKMNHCCTNLSMVVHAPQLLGLGKLSSVKLMLHLDSTQWASGNECTHYFGMAIHPLLSASVARESKIRLLSPEPFTIPTRVYRRRIYQIVIFPRRNAL